MKDPRHARARARAVTLTESDVRRMRALIREVIERHTTIVAELVRAGVYPALAVDLALEAEAGEPN